MHCVTVASEPNYKYYGGMTPIRVAVASNFVDASIVKLAERLRKSCCANLSSITKVKSYVIVADIARDQITKVAKMLTNTVLERSSTDGVLHPQNTAIAIEIGYLPGVTDNVAHTVKDVMEDVIGRKLFQGEDVYTSVFYFLQGDISREQALHIASGLHNPLIEQARIWTKDELDSGVPTTLPVVKLVEVPDTSDVDLDISDDALRELGKNGIQNTDGTRRGPLALSLNAMKAIRDYFVKVGRKPTDVEIESLAQTWSEHCKHSIFSDPLDDVQDGIYRQYIKGATRKIRAQKGKDDFCVSVFTDNAGAIEFDSKYLITHKVETHNSPSALDPFGGAVTGIVGVNRDALGFGLGAKPIANTYGFCVGDTNDNRALFRDKELSNKMLTPARILEGVVKGINTGGNQSGIPTPMGFVVTDESYRGKPLVFAGTVGLIPRALQGSGGEKIKSWQKSAQKGDYVVMVGGRVGLDGIHGATFSSESLSSGSPATAVQIGDPITQKKMSDAIIREIRDAGLYSSITDNGAGGLSCSVSEMARDMNLPDKKSGGCDVDLSLVPLKYAGLSPWEIWISESQERMTLSVPRKHWKRLKKAFDRHGVEATIIGTFTDSGKCIVRYQGQIVADIDMEFLHDGRPVEHQHSAEVVSPNRVNIQTNIDARRVFEKIISSQNVASTSFIASQYDHTVQGSSVSGPFFGKGRINADVAVIAPVLGSMRGVVLSQGLLPWYSRYDAYAMAASSIDTAIRNALCAGASLARLAILDNFCWSSSREPSRLYELKRAAKACYDVAVAYGTPFISGKDSMFNDFCGYDAHGKNVFISAQPTLLISAIGVVDDVSRVVSPDFKKEVDLLYVLGATHDELAGSEYDVLFECGGHVPNVDLKANVSTYKILEKVIAKGYVASAMPVGRGGLAVAVAKSSIAGMIGADVEFDNLPGNVSSGVASMWGESQGRVLVSVRPEHADKFEKLCAKIAYARIGVVGGNEIRLKYGADKFDISIHDTAKLYKKTFANW